MDVIVLRHTVLAVLKMSWVAAAVTLGMAAAAHAQGAAEPKVDDPPPAAVPSAVPSTALPPEKSGSVIAPPGPYAPPAKVQEAKDTAKRAELTPIVPSPANPNRPAFQLYAESDLPVLGVGLVFAAARLFRTQGPICDVGRTPSATVSCDPNALNWVDRTTAGTWSPAWSLASDVGLYSISGAAAAVLFADEGFLPGLNDALVIAESALNATALASVASLGAGRPRPFVYGTKAPFGDRQSADASLSFVSGHTAVSFAIATSTYLAMRRLEPKSSLPFFVIGIGGAGASFVAAARVFAGKHFITDAIAGAIIGTSVGILVPAIHSSPVKIVPVVSDTRRGLEVTGSF